jgi:hypothetical protein
MGGREQQLPEQGQVAAGAPELLVNIQRWVFIDDVAKGRVGNDVIKA